MKKRFKKKNHQVRKLIPNNLPERAANFNPLAVNQESAINQDVPRITNETIAVHREQVLKGARKYIYPLQHSKHRIIILTSIILSTAVLSLLAYCTLALYKFYDHNSFLYRTTQVIPFPIARSGNSYIAYENYLFELNHYVHYYQNQLGRTFSGEDKQQLLQFRRQALDDVINNAYIKKLAADNKVNVSSREIEARIMQVRNQNRLGGSNKAFADVLRDYWGWSMADFKRSLKDQILADKVVAKLDTQASQKADSLLVQLRSGADFAAVAKSDSSDISSQSNGGDYGFAISKTNPNVPPQVVEALFKLQPGQISGVINTGSNLEIVKAGQVSGDTITAQHITVKLKDINDYIKPLKQKHPARIYVKF